jgi:NAD(P)-dependent dehydrogenase (short-subunit alcohol dehydrogenase family)
MHERLAIPVISGQRAKIAHVSAFLASDEALYITGQSFYVDSGWVAK